LNAPNGVVDTAQDGFDAVFTDRAGRWIFGVIEEIIKTDDARPLHVYAAPGAAALHDLGVGDVQHVTTLYRF
jgi:hypothetical protein